MLLDISICIIIFLIGLNFKYFFKGYFNDDNFILNSLFVFHFLIAILFYFYVSKYGGDAILYWEYPKTHSFTLILKSFNDRPASGIIYLINYFPSKILNLSFFTGNMLYALIGYFGIIYFYKISKILILNYELKKSIKLFGISIFPWLWFLPNLHFWSSGIGKDAILFFCISFFIYSLLRQKKYWFGIILSLMLSLLIRPHITLFLLFSFAIGILFDVKLKGYKKTIIMLFITLGFLLLFDNVMSFIQLDSLDFNSIDNYTAKKAFDLSNAATSSAIDISAYSFPYKFFTFLFRPLFFDINNFMAILASFENIILLFFMILIIKNKPLLFIKKGSFIVKGMFVFFIIGTISFSLILGNLGIILRQKNMFIPILIILGMGIIFSNNNILIKND